MNIASHWRQIKHQMLLELCIHAIYILIHDGREQIFILFCYARVCWMTVSQCSTLWEFIIIKIFFWSLSFFLLGLVIASCDRSLVKSISATLVQCMEKSACLGVGRRKLCNHFSGNVKMLTSNPVERFFVMIFRTFH